MNEDKLALSGIVATARALVSTGSPDSELLISARPGAPR
jgi:hypothetical protein